MRCCVLAFALLGLSVPAKAEDFVTISWSKELLLTEFLDEISKVTTRPVIYDPLAQHLRGATMGTSVTHKVPRERFFDTARAILAFYEMTLVPVGPAGHELYLVVDTRSSNNLIRNKSIYLPEAEVERYADQDGLYVATAIPVRHVENLTTLRTALSSLVTPAGIGRVMEVPDGSAILVQDFAPTVAAIRRAVRALDVERPERRMVRATIQLEHARAEEVAGALLGLYATVVAPGPANRPIAASSPGPRIVAYAPRNALLIVATAAQLEAIRETIKSIDLPPG